MSIQRNLQIRIPVAENESLKEFEYAGKTFEVLGVSDRNDLIPMNQPMGSVCNGRVKQYKAKEEESDVSCEIYVYYYGGYFGGQFAVVDVLEYVS